MLLHELLADWAADAPDDVALVVDDEHWAVGRLWDEVRAAAAGLAAAHGGGPPVGVASENRVELVAALYAAPLAGVPLLLLNTRLVPVEQQALVDDVGAEVVWRFTPGERLDAWEAVVDDGRSRPTPPPPAESDLAWLIHTSGTTGRPKGVRLTHRSLLAAVRTTAAARPLADDDVYLFPFPLFHVAAYNVVHAHLRRRPVVLLARFEAGAVLDAVEAHGVTAMSLAPTMISMLLDDPRRAGRDLSSLRTIAYGASAVPREVLVRGMAELGCDFAQGYGMTELSGNAVFLGPAEHRRAATTDPHLLAAAGRPGPGVELRLVDDGPDGSLVDVAPGEAGEIAVRSEQVADGYWGQPDATAATFVDGWLRTGDVGRFDDEGILYVVDRRKDLVVTGGENVASREVEDVVGAHPAVGSAAVVGVPDERWGERVVAVVVAAPGATVDEAELIAWCRERLAGFKCPKQVVVVDELPLNASGKVLKTELRARWATG